MSIAVSVVIGLIVITLLLAISAERDRQVHKKRRELIFLEGRNHRYQDPLEIAATRILAGYQGFQSRLVERYRPVSVVSETLFFAEIRGGAVTLTWAVFLGVTVLFGLLVYAGIPSVASAIFALVALPITITYWILYRVRKRRELFQNQLPEFLLLLSSSLKSGLSLMTAIESVSQQGNGEIERQFRRSVREISLGLKSEKALEALAIRSDSQDMQMVIAALETQREVGGNLSDVLETVAETARERAELAQEIKVLSSEGRLSAVFLTLLPIVVFGFFAIFNPSYVDVFWTEPVGVVLAALFFTLIAVGAIWIRVLVRIRV